MPPTSTPTISVMRSNRKSGTRMVSAGALEENGSSETATLARFATANITIRMASGMRMTAAMNLRIMAPREWRSAPSRPVETLAHFLAGLEERHALLIDRYVGAGARIAAGA